MTTLAKVALGVVAFEHLYFLVLEMFLFATPFGRKTFGTTEAFAKEARPLAANQGLYNGFLAAGLVWAIVAPVALGVPVATFFLTCVVIAGLYGGLTVKRAIVFLQAIPALVALVLVYLR